MHMNRSLFFQFILIQFFGILVSNSFAQTNHIVVNSISSDFTTVDLNTEINGLNLLKYEIDLDQNNVPDLTFISAVHGGTGTAISSTTVTAGDNCTFVVNNKGRVHFISPYKDTVYFSAHIVNIFNSNDTLYSDSCHTFKETIFAESMSQSGLQVKKYIDEWISGPHYMGIKKIFGQKEYLGWIKLDVTAYYAIKFKGYTIQTLPVGIPEEEQSSVLVYPNPVNNELILQGIHYKQVEVFDAIGSTVLTCENKNQDPSFTIDVQRLKPGVYFIRVITPDYGGYAVTKFVKY